MAFDDFFRVGAHAVCLNALNQVLLLKATYADKGFHLPGGSLDPGETIHEALLRECKEELGLEVKILYMSGIYFHQQLNSHTCIFRCELPENGKIILSNEHSEYRYFSLDELSEGQRHRILDCLNFDGIVKSARFA